MIRYCIKRVVSILPVLFIVSVLLFTLMKLMPGDPVALALDPNIKPALYEESYEIKEKELGLDKPLVIQYTYYMKELLQGNLGYSSTYQRPVREVIARPLMNTLILNSVVVVISLVVSILIGIYSALHKNSLVDHVVQIISSIGISIPTFFISALLIYVFALKLRILPIGGMPIRSTIMEWMYYLVLPVLSMSILSISSITRYIRAEIIEIFQSDYIKAARARGISGGALLYHALKNAMTPIITIVMAELGTLISGSMIVEVLFSWDGIGSLLMEALHMRDAYLVISMNMLYAVIYVFSNLLADIGYTIVDPRIVLE